MPYAIADDMESVAVMLGAKPQEFEDLSARVKQAAYRGQAWGLSLSPCAKMGALMETLETTAHLLELKAEALRLAELGLLNQAAALEGRIAEMSGELSDFIAAGRDDPFLFEVPVDCDTTSADAVEALAGVDPAAGAEIFEALNQDTQLWLAANRPDLVVPLLSQLDSMPPDVKAELRESINHVVNSYKLGAKAAGEISGFGYYAKASGNVYGEVTINSDGTSKLTLALGIEVGAGKELEAELEAGGYGWPELDLEAQLRLGVIKGDQGLMELTFDSPEAAQEKLDNLLADIKDDLHVENWRDLPNFDWQKNLLDGDHTPKFTYVSTAGAEASASASAGVSSKRGDGFTTAFAGASAELGLGYNTIYKISTDGSMSYTTEIEGSLGAEIEAGIKKGDATKKLGLNGELTGSVQTTIGYDGDQPYVEYELNHSIEGGGQINRSGGSVVETTTTTIRYPVSKEAFNDIGSLLKGDLSGVYDGSEITQRTTRSINNEQTLYSGSFDGKIEGEGSIKTYSESTLDVEQRTKPLDGGFYDNVQANDDLDDVSTADNQCEVP